MNPPLVESISRKPYRFVEPRFGLRLPRSAPDVRRLASHFLLDCEEAADSLEEFGRGGARLGLVQVKNLAVRMPLRRPFQPTSSGGTFGQLRPTSDFNDAAGAIEFIVAGIGVRL